MTEKPAEKNVCMIDSLQAITKGLFELRDESYRDFHAGLIPNVAPDRIIGVRTPELRKYAKKVAKEPCAEVFLRELPHTYYEENNLHGELLMLLYRELPEFLEHLEVFLPYVDNWATCDLLSPKVFKKDLPLVYEHVKQWLASGQTYTVRFGIVTLLSFFLDEAFDPKMLQLVADVRSQEYYVRMAVAWYFSIALIKQYDAAIPYFTSPVLDVWTHNKAIRKARESYRIDAEKKAYLNTLRLCKSKEI